MDGKNGETIIQYTGDTRDLPICCVVAYLAFRCAEYFMSSYTGTVSIAAIPYIPRCSGIPCSD